MSSRRIRLESYARLFMVRIAVRSPNTQSRYGSQLRRHIVPLVGRRWLHRFEAADLQRLLGELLDKQMAPSSCCSIGRLALRVIAAAALDGFEVVAIDPRRIVWPRNQLAPVEPRAFTGEESNRILAACEGWPRVLFATLALSGLRIGEALGLEWAHVDFGAGLLRVRQQASRGRLRILKTGISRADLPLHPTLQAILLAYWRSEGEPSTGLLFGRYGLPRSSQGIAARHLAPALARAGIPPGTLHSFRHGYCAELWRAGVNAEVIRRLMRHSTLVMTLRYSHVAPTELRDAVDRLAQHQRAAA